MLDPKKLRKETDQVATNLAKRGFNFDLTVWNDLEAQRKSLQGSNEAQQSKLNEISKEIGIAIKQEKDTTDLKQKASDLTTVIKEQSKKLEILLEEINQFTLSLPNLVDDDIPEGKDESNNLEIYTEGTPRQFSLSLIHI